VTLKSAIRLIGALLVTFVCLGMAYAQNIQIGRSG
jgi:hypothetical protein